MDIQTINFSNTEISADKLSGIKMVITQDDPTIFKIVNDTGEYSRGIHLNNIPNIITLLKNNKVYIRRIVVNKLHIRVCDSEYTKSNMSYYGPAINNDNTSVLYRADDNSGVAILKFNDDSNVLKFYDINGNILDIKDYELTIIGDIPDVK